MKKVDLQQAKADAIEEIKTSEHFVLVSFGSDLSDPKPVVIVGEEILAEMQLVVVAQLALTQLCELPTQNSKLR